MKIVIAGAGAGKTTSMSDEIVELRKKIDDSKNIFCITFTNSAVKCIEKKLKVYYGGIPNNIIVSTIHSFLYREFIKPYYYLLYNRHYEKISTAVLPSNVIYKNGKIKRLDDINIIHQSVIPERAKWIILKKSSDKKLVKDKRLVIMNVFKNYCGAICIDEAQDIDNNMQLILEELHKRGIWLLLMGDPKQDLKGHKCLRTFEKKYIKYVRYEKICHRCPQNHLKFSNLLIPCNEKQDSKKMAGDLIICFEKDKSCKELLEEKNFDLCYISKKQEIYETHKLKQENFQTAISEEIEIEIKEKYSDMNQRDRACNSYYYADKLVKNYAKLKDKEQAMKVTFQHKRLNKKIYARIINMLPEQFNQAGEEKIFVNSIDCAKGQEGYNCLFILTTDLAEYIWGNKKDETTTKNKLYVALTRSLDKLTIFITKKVDDKYGRAFIINFFRLENIQITLQD